MEKIEYQQIVAKLVIDRILHKLKPKENRIYVSDNVNIMLDIMHLSPDHQSVKDFNLSSDKNVKDFLHNCINRTRYNFEDKNSNFFVFFEKFKKLLIEIGKYVEIISKCEVVADENEIGIYYKLTKEEHVDNIGFYMMYTEKTNTLRLFITQANKYTTMPLDVIYFLK